MRLSTHIIRFGLLFVATVAASVCPVLAGTPPLPDGFGWLKAQSNGAGFPSGSPIALELQWDNGAPNGGSLLAAARGAARHALTAKGYRIDAKSPYVLLLNIDMPEFPALRDEDDDRQSEAPARPDGMALPRLRDQWRIPLGRRPTPVPATIAIQATVFNRRGDVLWTGTTKAAYDGNHPANLVRRMVSATVSVVGAHAERNFILSCENNGKSDGICLG